MFSDIKIFTYIRPVKCNSQIINGRKAPGKRLGLVIIKTIKTNIIVLLKTSYYMPQNPQNKISQIAIKHYIQLISVRTEALIWVQITTDTGMNLKVETTLKKYIKNYWNSLPFMYLKLDSYILQVSTSSIYPLFQSSTVFSTNTPFHGNSFIAIYFALLTVS